MGRLLAIAVALLLGTAARADSPPPDPGPPGMLRSTFPDALHFEAVDLLLTDQMAKQLEELARSCIGERMVTFYVARGAGSPDRFQGGPVLGYAVLQSHVVRTKRETLLLAFEPDGRIRRIVVLSFLEPPEYKPSERWLGQFAGKTAADRLAVGDDLAPISGATLSARGVAEQSRWLLQALQMARQERRVP